MTRILMLAAGAALIMQGGAMAQSQDGASGFLPAASDLLDLRSDSRRTVRHQSGDRAGKAEADLAGAPRPVETQSARYERANAPLPAAQPVDEKGQAAANLVMTGGGEGEAATQYSFHLEDGKTN